MKSKVSIILLVALSAMLVCGAVVAGTIGEFYSNSDVPARAYHPGWTDLRVLAAATAENATLQTGTKYVRIQCESATGAKSNFRYDLYDVAGFPAADVSTGNASVIGTGDEFILTSGHTWISIIARAISHCTISQWE